MTNTQVMKMTGKEILIRLVEEEGACGILSCCNCPVNDYGRCTSDLDSFGFAKEMLKDIVEAEVTSISVEGGQGELYTDICGLESEIEKLKATYESRVHTLQLGLDAKRRFLTSFNAGKADAERR